jgi:hypothetical protein
MSAASAGITRSSSPTGVITPGIKTLADIHRESNRFALHDSAPGCRARRTTGRAAHGRQSRRRIRVLRRTSLSSWFHVFYHPFTGLFWNQLAGGGFDRLYDVNLQQNPDQIDPGADAFSFQTGYQPVVPPVWWDHDDVTGQDRQCLDFTLGSAFGVYNWLLFDHVPLYIASCSVRTNSSMMP